MSNHPQRIGNYTLERNIGRGGSSQVWLARHQSLENRPVAIKLLTNASPEWIERFTQEAAITSRLRHEHIIQIFDHGQHERYYYTIMEYVAGGSLLDVFRNGQRPNLDQTLHIFRCAGSALDYAHASGIVHRDISPGNILLEAGAKRVLLTDFGIARETGKTGITTVSAVMGTPGYFSPEHAISATAVTHLSDIYSLGVVLFEMLSGKQPWIHTPGMQDGGGGPFERPRTLADVGVTNLPAGVDRVIQTMMAVDPTKRYPSVQLAIEDLDQVLNRHSATTQVVGGATPKGTATGTTMVARPPIAIAPPVERHPVETVLGPDLLKGPMQEARKHTDQLSQPQEIATLLDRWSQQGLRRRLLGRQAFVHRVTHSNVYFYQLRVLYETRTPAVSIAEPDRKAAQFTLEKELTTWEVPLPAPKQFTDEAGGTVRIPGSLRVAACVTCNGVARVPCTHCKGKGRITVLTEAPAGTTIGAPASKIVGDGRTATGSVTATTTTATRTQTIIPCPACSGSGGVKCTTCDGVGRMLQQKTTTWSRKAAAFRDNDDLPNVDEAWLAKTCEPSKIYHEQQVAGFRAGWEAVPIIASLIKQANAGVADQNTRVAMSELTISLVPMSEVLFDLGEQARAKGKRTTQSGGKGQLAQPVVGTYSMYIYGFQRNIPNDWRFLNWDRVGVLLLTGAVIVLLVVLLLLPRLLHL